MTLPSDAQKVKETLEKELGGGVRNIFLYGSAVLIVLGFGAFAIAPWWLALAMIVVGLVSFIVVDRTTRKPPQVKLSVLKGASPFGVDEGELFAELGREADLAELRSWILGEQVAVILVWGKSGVGKTSLINAGVRHNLREARPDFLYTDASQLDIERSVIDANRHLAATRKDLPESLEEMINSDRKRKQVVVIDNIDQAADRNRLIDWARLALNRGAPYRRVFIFILSEGEFHQHWNQQTWPPRSASALKKLPIDKLTEGGARDVASRLSEKAGLAVSEELVKEMVADITVTDEVSPLVLSVLLQRIGKASGGGQPFGVEDYHNSGRAAGLLGVHIKEHLENLAPKSWQGALRGIAQQVSPDSPSFSRTSLNLSDLTSAELSALLAGLSSPEVRVLRVNHDQTTYRILDDWVGPFLALREYPNPEIALIESQVKGKYQWWFQNRRFGGPRVFRLLREGRYLLTRAELGKIEQYRESLRFGDAPALLKYITRSRLYRTGQLVAFGALAVALAFALVVGYAEMQRWQATKIMRAYGLPSDFPSYARQVKSLTLACRADEVRADDIPGNDLQWLLRDLKSLDVKCSWITSLKGIPQNLDHLGLSDSGVTKLDGLPPRVVDLNISGTGIRGIEGLQGHQIESLDASGIRVTNMKLLPRSVTELKLQHPEIDNLEGLPDGLTDLELRGTVVRSLRGLPRNLRRLTLVGNDLLVVDSLPPQLEKLVTDRSPAGVAVPRSLRTLILIRVGPDKAPEGIKELELKGSFGGIPPAPMADLPGGLETLRLHDIRFQLPWDRLDGNLRHLKARWQEGYLFEALPKHLIELDLSGSASLTSLEGLGKVSILDISSTAIPDFRDVPDSVKTLRYESCIANGLTEFPKHLATLDLAGCRDLEVLENLPDSLTELNVSKTAISKLENLPKNLRRLDISNSAISGSFPEIKSPLEQLTLHAGQIDTLRGLPKSVWKIRFVDREKKK